MAKRNDEINLPAVRQQLGNVFAAPAVRQRIADFGGDPGMWRSYVLNALEHSPKLAGCTIRSIGHACMKALALKLLPNGRDFALVPFGDECVLIIQYHGMISLAYRSQLVAKVDGDVVYERDEFDFSKGSGDFEYFKHRPLLAGDRGKRIAAWARCKMRTGGEIFLVMGAAEIQKHKKCSRGAKSSDSPWTGDWEDAMWIKTAVRSLADWMPQSPEMTAALSYEAAEEGGVIPVTPLLTIDTENDPFDADAAAKQIESSKGAEGLRQRLDSDKQPATADVDPETGDKLPAKLFGEN